MEGTCRTTVGRRGLLVGAAGAAAVGAGTRWAAAQGATGGGWPARPVRVVVSSSPGGGMDVVSRLLFAKVSEALGEQFVIENRGGGGGTIGAGIVARAPADGYTVLYDSTQFSVNPALREGQLPYDTLRDFEPVFLSAVSANLLVVHPSVPARSVAEVIAIVRAAPGGLDWASSGPGTLQHLLLEMFARMAQVRLNHIPYRGGGPALTDVVGGRVKFYFGNAAPRPRTSAAARSGRSPTAGGAGSRRCPTCRRCPTPCPASRATTGTASWCPRGRRARSSSASMPRSMPRRACPTWPSGWPR
ncbi:MAG: tripartite tricarboxylate transporter substrate binding protein [Acetobacteraceae bacterium]|nr:tripartite tricarboxylate transporter substrate binding protein [Acetobacteraceae bacterium]